MATESWRPVRWISDIWSNSGTTPDIVWVGGVSVGPRVAMSEVIRQRMTPEESEALVAHLDQTAWRSPTRVSPERDWQTAVRDVLNLLERASVLLVVDIGGGCVRTIDHLSVLHGTTIGVAHMVPSIDTARMLFERGDTVLLFVDVVELRVGVVGEAPHAVWRLREPLASSARRPPPAPEPARAPPSAMGLAVAELLRRVHALAQQTQGR